MLQTMRERMQGIIAGVIVGLICVTFALWGVQYYLHGASGADTVAKAGNTKITQENWRITYERLRHQKTQNSLFDQEAQKQFKNEVLNKMIRNAILVETADHLGFQIGTEELQMVVFSMPFFQVDGKFSPERLQEVLSNMLYTEDAFLKETRDSMILMQLEDGIEHTAFVLPEEINTAYKLAEETRDINYFLIPKDKFANELKITDADIKDYYQKHQNEFMTQESVSIQYLQLSSDKLLNKLDNISDRELQKFYTDNIDLFSSPKKFTVQRILINLPKNATSEEVTKAKTSLDGFLKQTKTGGDFAKLAPKQFSTFTKTRVQMRPDFAKALDNLKVGQISDSFRTEDGYNLVKLVGILQSKPLPFKNVEKHVRDTYTKQKEMQIFTEENDKLSDLTYTNSDTLEPAKKALGLDIQTTEVFPREGGKSGLTANPKIFKAAFSDSILLQGYNSNPIETQPGTVVVLRIKEHNLAKARPLSEVQSIIEKHLKELALANKAKATAEEILAALEKKTNAADIAKRYNLVWKDAVVNKSNKILPKGILDAAFAMPSSDEGKHFSLAALANGDYVVIQLDEVIPADIRGMEPKERVDMQKNLSEKFGQYDYESLIREALMRTKVERYTVDTEAQQQSSADE